VTSVEQFVFALTLFSALGCGLVAGVLFAFSAFVIRTAASLAAAASFSVALGY
jgi:uncharacterized membrane protein